MQHIWDNLYISIIDKYNIGLIKLGTNKKGEQTKKILGYYSDLESVLKKAISIQLMHKYKDRDTINILKELKVIHKEIKKLNCNDIITNLKKDIK